MNTNPALDNLMEEAFLTILLHPGITFNDWRDTLTTDCPTEIADTLATLRQETPDLTPAALLATIWARDYTDPHTHQTMPLSAWPQHLRQNSNTTHHLAIQK